MPAKTKLRDAPADAPMDPFALAADIFDPPDWISPSGIELLPYQQVPQDLKTHKSDMWLLEAGRGTGKTQTCAHYCASQAHRVPGMRGRIIAPTTGDAIEACVRGPSGLMRVDPEVTWHPSADGGAKVKWPNGSEMLVIGTPQPRDVDRLRAGGNRELDWWEELAANTQLKDAWDQAAFGLREGFPHRVCSTTPRNTTAYREIRKTPGICFTRASLFDNPHLPESFVKKMREKYEGTRLGRQELRGELLDDVEGALWTRFMLDNARLKDPRECPQMHTIVIAVDPAATSSEEADDTGIVVIGHGTDGWGYVLDDLTCHLSPDGWGTRVARAFYKWEADYVIGEINNGGEMVEYVIATADPRIPFKPVRASRGKQTRAQPVSALYGDGKVRPSRIKHLGAFTELEDQMCSWVPGEEDSPDNMDALVWGITELFLAEDDNDQLVEYWEPQRIGANI
jgi:phage terminase large subunit-like protein